MADKNNKKNTVAAPVAPVIAAPVVVESIAASDLEVPTAQVETTEEIPLAAPTAVVPNLVFEQTVAATDGTADAPTFDVTGKTSRRVRVITDSNLGLKMLKKGDITDDEEYVALLDTERGRLLVEEVK